MFVNSIGVIFQTYFLYETDTFLIKIAINSDAMEIVKKDNKNSVLCLNDVVLIYRT